MTLKSIIALSLLAVTALTSVEASTQANKKTTTVQRKVPPQKSLSQHLTSAATKVVAGATKGATKAASGVVSNGVLQIENRALLEEATAGMPLARKKAWISRNLTGKSAALQNRILKGKIAHDANTPRAGIKVGSKVNPKSAANNICITPDQIEAAIEKKMAERKKRWESSSRPDVRPGSSRPTVKPSTSETKQTPQQLAAAKKKEEEMQKAAAKKKKEKEKKRLEQGKQENKQACADLIETPINSQRMLTNILSSSTKNNCSLSEEGKIFNNACQAFIKGIPLSETTMAENGCTAQARNAGLEVVKTEGGMVMAQKPVAKKEEQKKEEVKKEEPKVVSFEDMTDEQRRKDCDKRVDSFDLELLSNPDDLKEFRKYWNSKEIKICMAIKPEKRGESSPKQDLSDKVYDAVSNQEAALFPTQLGALPAMKKKFSDDGIAVKDHKINGKGIAVGLVLSDEAETKPAAEVVKPVETPTSTGVQPKVEPNAIALRKSRQ